MYFNYLGKLSYIFFGKYINPKTGDSSIIVEGDNDGDISTNCRIDSLETEVKYLKEIISCKDKQLEEKERLIKFLMNK
jgi:hypothetical protein